jgi:hypothetical protein
LQDISRSGSLSKTQINSSRLTYGFGKQQVSVEFEFSGDSLHGANSIGVRENNDQMNIDHAATFQFILSIAKISKFSRLQSLWEFPVRLIDFYFTPRFASPCGLTFREFSCVSIGDISMANCDFLKIYQFLERREDSRRDTPLVLSDVVF